MIERFQSKLSPLAIAHAALPCGLAGSFSGKFFFRSLANERHA